MKMTQSIKALTFAAGAWLLTGCNDNGPKVVDSDRVGTGQIFATYQVISDGSGYVYAEAQLTRLKPPSESEEDDEFVNLVKDDELWLSNGTNLKDQNFSGDIFGELDEMSKTQTRFRNLSSQREIYEFLFYRTIINPFGDWYSAKLPESESNEYQISLFRGRNAEAKYSNVTLPQEFTIVAPGSLDLYSRSMDDILIEWTDTETDITVEVETTVACTDQTFETFSETLNIDNGMYTISAGTLVSASLVGRCNTTVNVRKALVGTVDPILVGGLASGYQIRRVSFVTQD